MTDTPRLLYVADAMCSWCYGFAPVLAAFLAQHPELPVTLVQGGLRPGRAAQVVDDDLRQYLAGAWAGVARTTGRAIDRELPPLGWRYDSEPAARAVAAVRRQHPGQALAYFRRVQDAFYGRGEDVTDFAVLGALAGELGLDRPALARLLADESLGQDTLADYRRARALGVRGFPSLFLEQDGQPRPLAAGYRPLADLERALAPYRCAGAQSPSG